MKTSRLIIFALSFWFVLSALPRPVLADEYDESQSHPLRGVAYVLHPVGRIAEWLFARPFHALVSSNRGMEYLFGHTPHPPLFEPKPITDVGMSRQYQTSSVDQRGTYLQRMTSVSRERARRGEEVLGEGSEKVIIKEVPVIKTIIKEVPKVVIKEVLKIVEVEKVIFPDVAFRFDSDKLTPLGKGKVYLTAQKLKEKSDILVVIEGHADIIGTDDYNMVLGLRRAEKVKKELEELGIGPERVSVVSVGETKPLIEQETDWARAVNRRVELRIEAN